ncbi:hypothetical protein V1512DRAFT_231906 [Lipomyces arxii]|uniref:uncharacterized protein n=1 Tax=Lipomyces arxii TaxID=56418 RepID=UPI0034CDAE40
MAEQLPFANALSASPELFARLLPTVFFDKYISLNPPVRPSLRAPEQFRSCSMNTSALVNTLGSSVVRMGECIAVCGITGYVVDFTELGPSALYTNIDIVGRTGPPQHELMSMSNWMFETAAATKLFDSAQLLIPDTTQSLVLQAQIQLFSQTYSLDVAWTALLSALAVTRLPKAIKDDKEDVITADFSTEPRVLFSRTETVPLILNYTHLPWYFNFGVMQDTGIVIADLEGRVEELSIQGRISLVLAADSAEIQNLSISAGKSTVSKEQILKCVELARQRAAELDSILQTQLQ